MTEDRSPVTARRHLVAPAVPETVDAAHLELEALWVDAAEVDPTDRMRFELAVIEVLANIVEHAYAADDGPEVRGLDVDLRVHADRLEADLHDDGVPAALDLSAVTMPGEDAESGRGLALALASVDDLAYSREDGRNRWRLVCRRSG